VVVGGGGSNSQKLGVGVVADQLGGVTSSVVDYVKHNAYINMSLVL